MSRIKIYEVDGEYGHSWSVSENSVWLPGAYESEEAARFAPKLSDQSLQRLQDRVNAAHEDFAKRVITMDMLRAQAEVEAADVAADDEFCARPHVLAMRRFVIKRLHEDAGREGFLDGPDHGQMLADSFANRDEPALRRLAAEWSGHADYQGQDWAPTTK